MKVMSHKNDLRSSYLIFHSQGCEPCWCVGHPALPGTTLPDSRLSGPCGAAHTSHCPQGCLVSGGPDGAFQPMGLERHHRPSGRHRNLLFV